MRILLLSIVFTLIIVAVSSPSFGQTPSKQFIDRLAEQWQIERSHADSIAKAKGMPIRVEREDGSIFELQRFVDGRPMYYKTTNLNAAKSISTNKVWTGAGFGFSLSGSTDTLAIWDGGAVRNTHQEFGGRVISIQGANADHATHVAGTMIASGFDPTAIGMSNGARLRSYDWNSDLSEMATAAAAGLRVSNHSYGSIAGWNFDYFSDGKWAWFGDIDVSTTEDYSFGFYDNTSLAWDNVANNAPYYLPVVSAGNDRGEGPSGTVEHWVFGSGGWELQTVARNKDGGATGYDCQEGSSVSKNVLTVGAVSDLPSGYSTASGVVMSSFSAWGPTDDGRIKPDIVGNGVSLWSSVSSSNTAYSSFSGTSMSTPNVSGSIGLLLQNQKNMHGNNPLRSSTMKALLLHTADEAGSAAGPDYKFGWGLMNTLRAAQLMRTDSLNGSNSNIRELTLNQGDTIRVNIKTDGSQPLKATVCWNDPFGSPTATILNPTTLMLVNDLDMRIINSDDQSTYSPWVLDPSNRPAAATTGDNFRDNVEQVYMATPPAGFYTVAITHKGTLSGGSQVVSLIISGNVQVLTPIASVIPGSFNIPLDPYTVTNDSFKIRNTGNYVLNYEVQDSLAPWLLVTPDSGSVARNDSATLIVTIDASAIGQWQALDDTIEIVCNDSANTPLLIPVHLQTQGPKISLSKSFVTVDIDSGFVTSDTIRIKNIGSQPLHFAVSDTIPAPWLSLLSDSATIAPGDSFTVVLILDASTTLTGDSATALRIVHTDSSITDIIVDVEFHIGTRRTLNVNFAKRWNLVSVPIIPLTYLKPDIFPPGTSNAYAYDGSYTVEDTLRMGSGYWLKFDSARTVSFYGNTVMSDTFEVTNGWNLIGSLTSNIFYSSITSDPADIISSPLYGYGSSYQTSDRIYPGKGYWIQVSQPGILIMNATPVALPKFDLSARVSAFNRLIISDDEQNTQTLYFGIPLANSNTIISFNLPPRPPSGSFDARFCSGTMYQPVPPASPARMEYPIEIQSSSSRVSISWEVQSSDTRRYSIADASGTYYPLGKQSKIIVPIDPRQNIVTLIAEASATPKEFALKQNYPNPFNPLTIINYQLPVANFVTLKVFDVLGREIATLVNGVQQPGSYDVQWDASYVPSGVYYYRLHTGEFNSIKKMLLIK